MGVEFRVSDSQLEREMLGFHSSFSLLLPLVLHAEGFFFFFWLVDVPLNLASQIVYLWIYPTYPPGKEPKSIWKGMGETRKMIGIF